MRYSKREDPPEDEPVFTRDHAQEQDAPLFASSSPVQEEALPGPSTDQRDHRRGGGGDGRGGGTGGGGGGLTTRRTTGPPSSSSDTNTEHQIASDLLSWCLNFNMNFFNNTPARSQVRGYLDVFDQFKVLRYLELYNLKEDGHLDEGGPERGGPVHGLRPGRPGPERQHSRTSRS